MVGWLLILLRDITTYAVIVCTEFGGHTDLA